MIVVGSVAVSEKGYRIGKGEGFADLEWGMMATMGAVKCDTIVVTIVHDCQVTTVCYLAQRKNRGTVCNLYQYE